MSENTKSVYFYNSVDGDRKYDAESFGDWLRPFFTTGVFDGGLAVIGNGNMTVTIQPGYVNIGGKVAVFREPATLDLEVASGTLNRYSSVFVRRDDVSRDIYLIVKTGGLATNPTPLDPERGNGVFELKLADVYVAAGTISVTQANITDTRMNPDVCGWVASTVKELDFFQLSLQFDAYFSEFKDQTQIDYSHFWEWISTFKTDAQSDFGNWFDEIKDQLSQDAAGNLQNQIDAITAEYISDTPPENPTDGMLWLKPIGGLSLTAEIASGGGTVLRFSDADFSDEPPEDKSKLWVTLKGTI